MYFHLKFLYINYYYRYYNSSRKEIEQKRATFLPSIIITILRMIIFTFNFETFVTILKIKKSHF